MKLVCRVDAETWAALDERPLTLPVEEIEVRYGDESQTRRVRFMERLGIAYAETPGVVLRTWSKRMEETA